MLYKNVLKKNILRVGVGPGSILKRPNQDLLLLYSTYIADLQQKKTRYTILALLTIEASLKIRNFTISVYGSLCNDLLFGLILTSFLFLGIKNLMNEIHDLPYTQKW